MRSELRRSSIGIVVGSAIVAALLASPALVAGQRPADRSAQDVTFNKDILPILQRSCQNCHRPGSLAPMSLMTYEEARPWARSMKLRTSLRSKPNAMRVTSSCTSGT